MYNKLSILFAKTLAPLESNNAPGAEYLTIIFPEQIAVHVPLSLNEYSKL